MKVILTNGLPQDGCEIQYLDVTEDQLKFFNWLKDNCGTGYLCELFIEKVDEIDFKAI